jgi:hypothetical protein
MQEFTKTLGLNFKFGRTPERIQYHDNARVKRLDALWKVILSTVEGQEAMQMMIEDYILGTPVVPMMSDSNPNYAGIREGQNSMIRNIMEHALWVHEELKQPEGDK